MGFGDLPVSVDKQCARRSGDTARWEAEIGFVVVQKTPVDQTFLVKAAPQEESSNRRGTRSGARADGVLRPSYAERPGAATAAFVLLADVESIETGSLEGDGAEGEALRLALDLESLW